MDHICTKCEQLKPEEDFGTDTGGRNKCRKRRKNCKQCDRIRKQKYNAKLANTPQQIAAKEAYDQQLLAWATARIAREQEKADRIADRLSRPRAIDDPGNWKEWSRRCYAKNKEKYKLKLKESIGTWHWFYRTRWTGINRRTVNGSCPQWKSKISRRYLKRGTEVRMSREEFRYWCYQNRLKIEAMHREGKRPSIDRINHHGHYDLANIQVLPFLINCTKDN